MKANDFKKQAKTAPVPPKRVLTQKEVALRAGASILVGGLAMYVGFMGLCGRRVI